MKTSSWLCSLRAISVSLQGSTEMGRSAPQAADTAAAERGGSLCTANPVNPGDFRVPSAAMQAEMCLGGRDEPERDSGQGQSSRFPLVLPLLRGLSSHQATMANTKRHFRPLKILLLSRNNEAVHGGHNFPQGPNLAALPVLNPLRRSKIEAVWRMGGSSTGTGSTPPSKLQPAVPISRAGKSRVSWKWL